MLKYGSKVADPDFVPGQKETKSQITYNPYSLKDYKQIKQQDNRVKELSKGLGANIGDEKWQHAQDKKQKQAEYDRKLREMNKQFGVMVTENAGQRNAERYGTLW